MKRIAFVVLIATAVALANCGSPFPHSNEVTARVTPAQATVPVGETVRLSGDATGFTDPTRMIARWWVQDARDTRGYDCAFLEPPPTYPCEFGYVMSASVTTVPSAATYYAPDTPGIYQVVFEATKFTAYDSLSKTATATITVTP